MAELHLGWRDEGIFACVLNFLRSSGQRVRCVLLTRSLLWQHELMYAHIHWCKLFLVRFWIHSRETVMCAQKQEMASFLSCLGESNDAKATLHAEIRINLLNSIESIDTQSQDAKNNQMFALHTDIFRCVFHFVPDCGKRRIACLVYSAYIGVLHRAMLSTSLVCGRNMHQCFEVHCIVFQIQ